MSTDARKPCPLCGEQIAAAARKCRFCGEVFDPLEADEAPEGDATGGVIPYKNVPALMAYYLGVFSVIPCFPIGLAGVVLGIKGLQMAKQKPEVKGKVHAWIGILVGGFFGLLWLAFTAVATLAGVASR
jgi:hypothetical protein